LRRGAKYQDYPLMSTETKNKIVPKFRFPEFRNAEEWEEKSLGSVCETFSGGTPSTSQKEFYGGDIPFIRSAEIDKETTELFITKEGLENSSAKLINKGDVLVALYGANSGEVALAKLNGAINQAILCLQSEESNAFKYQFLILKQNWIVSTYIQGGQGNLSGEIVKSLKLLFPKPKEQQKIADCLSSLDELITAHNQKLEALQVHKKGLMQQLFPAEGETVPKLRFAGYSDEWEEKVLKDVCRMQAGKFVSASEINENNSDELFPCYGGNGLRGYTKSFTNEGEYSLIGRQGALCGNVTLADGKFHATEHAVVVTPKEKVDTIWLFYMLTHLNLNQYATGQAQPGLSVDNLEKVEVKIPLDEKEQQRIGECLSTIDELITVQAEKIEALKVHKKGLMQGLFPNPERAGYPIQSDI
jgi:type I restriction enzyme S subunit